MTIRNRNWGLALTVLLLFLALNSIAAFILFWQVAAPYCGERLSHNILPVAARYFPLCGIILLVFAGLGVLWLTLSERARVYEPLARLIHAANRLRDGDLNYELPVSGLGNFTQLGHAIEEMRIRLKDGVDKAERVESERIDVMNSICHDLKTPVTAIAGHAEGILDGVADTPEKVAHYARIILTKARRMSDLVEGLNFLTLLESQPPLSLEPVDMGSWVSQFAAELTDDAEIITETEPDLICLADRPKLARVFFNLVDNAMKYARSPEGGLVLRFSVSRKDDRTLITLQDNGPGLPTPETRKVFERFVRGDPSRGRVGGSGLGLSIARQIIRLHNGQIWLQNHKDGGLVAGVSLPLYKEDNTP